MATQNSINSSDPITVAQGGTGASTLTAHGVLLGQGTSAITATSVGTPGQVLTSNGSADPTYQTAPANNLVLIQTQSASNSATVTFTTGITSTYNNYFFIWSNAVPVNNTDVLEFQMSTNGGSSWVAVTAGINFLAYNSSTVTNNNSTVYVPLSAALSSTASLGCGGYLYLYNLTNGSDSYCSGLSIFNGSTSGAGTMGLTQASSVINTVNAVQVLMSTGNISTGTFSLYGILE